MEKEDKRQLIHISIGIAAIILFMLMPRGYFVGGIIVIVLSGLLLVNLRFLGMKIGIIEAMVGLFERENVRFAGWGSACYAMGVLIISSFLTEPAPIIAGIIILAFGDGMASIAGKRGRIKLPFNKNKTLEGMAAFFVFSLPAYFFIGSIAVIIALICAIVESMDFGWDDNLTIPIAYVLAYMVIT